MDNFKRSNLNFNSGGYIKGFFFSFISVVVVVGTLNYVVDPYMYHENRLKGINELPMADIELAARLETIVKLNYKGPTPPYTLLGTSHVLVGVTTCDYPWLEKISGTSMTMSENHTILSTILAKAKVNKTVFIEMAGSAPTSGREDSFIKRLFSLRTTVYTIRTLQRNWMAYPREKGTFCNAAKFIDANLQSVKDLNEQSASVDVNQYRDFSSLRDILIDDYRGTQNMQHQIIFFIAPLPKESLETANRREKIRRLSTEISQMIANNPSKSAGVLFRFVNLNDSNIGDKYQFKYGNFNQGWYDGNHFRPIIGGEVIKNLIAFANSEPR